MRSSEVLGRKQLRFHLAKDYSAEFNASCGSPIRKNCSESSFPALLEIEHRRCFIEALRRRHRSYKNGGANFALLRQRNERLENSNEGITLRREFLRGGTRLATPALMVT